MGGTLGNVFKGSNDVVQGTGQSVGELKKIGYGDDDIKTMGGGTPSAGVGITRNILRGAGGSFGSALSGGSHAMPVGGSPMLPSGPSPTAVDPSFFSPSAGSWGTNPYGLPPDMPRDYGVMDDWSSGQPKGKYGRMSAIYGGQ